MSATLLNLKNNTLIRSGDVGFIAPGAPARSAWDLQPSRLFCRRSYAKAYRALLYRHSRIETCGIANDGLAVGLGISYYLTSGPCCVGVLATMVTTPLAFEPKRFKRPTQRIRPVIRVPLPQFATQCDIVSTGLGEKYSVVTDILGRTSAGLFIRPKLASPATS